MISLQGIICKQLYDQGKLPEKYIDLAMRPIDDLGTKLVTSDEYILCDKNGLVLTVAS